MICHKYVLFWEKDSVSLVLSKCLRFILNFLTERFWVFLLKTKDSLSRKTNVDLGNARSGIEMCSHNVIYVSTCKPTRNSSEGFFSSPGLYFPWQIPIIPKCVFQILLSYQNTAMIRSLESDTPIYIQTPALPPMNCGDRGKFYLNSQNLDFFNCQTGIIIVPTS